MKSTVKSELKPGYAWIDRTVIESKMLTLGFKSQEQLSEQTTMSRRTFSRYLSMGQMPQDCLSELSKVLKIDASLLQPLTKTQRARQTAPSLPIPLDYETLEVVAVGCKAANGLSYDIYKLKSSAIPNALSRGKFYQLAGVSPSSRGELIHRLQRHGTVCEMLDSPYVAKFRTAIPLDGNLAWWVLDRWVDGQSLESLLEEGKQFSLAEVFKIGQQILLGLSDLHRHKIIVRELSPERVIYNGQDESVVLTDFEMAKLMDKGVPSVSGRWKHNSPYRAREVIEDIDQPWPHSLSYRSDLFSWAIIMIELLTGSTNTTPSAIRDKIENATWAELLIKCSNLAASKRPATVESVLQQWNQARG